MLLVATAVADTAINIKGVGTNHPYTSLFMIEIIIAINLIILLTGLALGILIRPLPWWHLKWGKEYIELKRQYQEGKKIKVNYVPEFLMVVGMIYATEVLLGMLYLFVK